MKRVFLVGPASRRSPPAGRIVRKAGSVRRVGHLRLPPRSEHEMPMKAASASIVRVVEERNGHALDCCDNA